MDETTKNLIRRQSQTISILFVIILVLLAMLLMTFCRKPLVKSDTNNPPQQAFFCGTRDLEEKAPRERATITGISGNFESGRKLFRQNCAVCHSTNNMKLTGPGLGGIFTRVPQPATNWIRNYILNNEKVKAAGDPYAKKLDDQYENSMTVFEGSLTDEQINNILFYLAGF